MNLQKKALTSILIILFSFFLYPFTIYACSSFCLTDNSNVVLGYDLDWFPIKGFVMSNPRQISKTAYITWEDKPASWVSKFGSITFNAFGKEFPFCGMNEAGLAVSQMWLNKTGYPEADERGSLSELQWIQYQLDNSETVADVIASDKIIRIAKETTAPLHFFVCDKAGNAATIEFINGQLVCHTGADLPVAILTNDPYRESLQTRDMLDSYKKKRVNPDIDKRFALGAQMLDYYPKCEKLMVDYAFDILDTIKQSNTRWSIVFDVEKLEIYYKTFRNEKSRKITLADFNFNRDAEALLYDVDAEYEKINNTFEKYTSEKNQECIMYNKSLILEFSKYSDSYWQNMAHYPETLQRQ